MILLTDSERLEGSFILELKRSLTSSILNKTENLHVKLGISNNTAISADVFVGNISSTNITFILNLNELSINNSSKYLQNVSDDLISRYSLDQSNLVIGLEISNLFLNASNDFKIVNAELKLSIDINLV